jgi:hypothetical protein
MREGRFSSAASEIAQRYSESVSFDRRLYHHDISGSIAHASALASIGILSADAHRIDTVLPTSCRSAPARSPVSENSQPAANDLMRFQAKNFAQPRMRSGRMCAKSLTFATQCSAAAPPGRLPRKTSSARSRAGAIYSKPNNSLFAR